MAGGWIYVFMTSSDYARYKVGLTKNNPMLRLNQLKTADPLIGFAVAYYVPDSLGKLSTIETMIHQQLGPNIEFHNGELSEWFCGVPQDAWVRLESIFKLLGYEVTDNYQPDGTKIVRFWEGNLNSFYAPPSWLDEHGLPWS